MPFDAQIQNNMQSAIINKILNTIQSRIENRPPELNGLLEAMLKKRQDDRPSIKELFLNFPILQNAILELMARFLRVNDFTFENLYLQLELDMDLKNAYSIRLDPMIE